MALIPTDINGDQILAFDGNGDSQLADETGRKVGQKAARPDGSEYKLYANGWKQTSFGGAVGVKNSSGSISTLLDAVTATK